MACLHTEYQHGSWTKRLSNVSVQYDEVQLRKHTESHPSMNVGPRAEKRNVNTAAFGFFGKNPNNTVLTLV